MLTEVYKKNRVKWAKNHLNDNWKNTLFTDETAFQLYQNTIERWYKGECLIRRMSKDRRKIFAWGGFCARGKTSLFCFQSIMDGKFYVKILENHLGEINKCLGRMALTAR